MIVYVKLLMAAFFWGGTFIAGRVVAQGVGPFSAAFLRFAGASLLLVLITRKIEGGLPRLKRDQIIPVVLLGMTGVFAYNVLFFLGLQTVTAGRASVIVAMNPIFIALFAALLFRERLSGINAAGIVLCVTGAVVVISHGSPPALLHGDVGRGELYVLGCVASWVLYSLIGKHAMRDLSAMAAVTYSCLIGDVLLLIPAWMEGLFSDAAGYRMVDWLGIAYLGIFGTVLSFTWYYEGIRTIGASRAAVFINFVPISAVVLAFLILGEILDISLIAGGGMVIGGAYLTNRKW
jgi:drug/metabolite transporter (DMT)-like permease